MLVLLIGVFEAVRLYGSFATGLGFLPVDFLRPNRPRLVKLNLDFFSAIYAPSSGPGEAPLTCSSITSHLAPGIRVSIKVHRPNAALRSVVSSLARLIIHTHQNVSSRSN